MRDYISPHLTERTLSQVIETKSDVLFRTKACFEKLEYSQPTVLVCKLLIVNGQLID